MKEHDYRKSIPMQWTHNEICDIIESYINFSNLFNDRILEVTKPVIEDEIWENNYKIGLFDLGIEALDKMGLDPEKIENSKTSCSVQIALLNELGFFDLPKVKEMTSTQKNKILSRLLNRGVRDVRGNINALNPDSNEDLTKYTSSNEATISKAKKIINE